MSNVTGYYKAKQLEVIGKAKNSVSSLKGYEGSTSWNPGALSQ